MQLQLEKQISHGTVQWVVAMGNVESSGVALQGQRCDMEGCVSPSLHVDAEGKRKDLPGDDRGCLLYMSLCNTVCSGAGTQGPTA